MDNVSIGGAPAIGRFLRSVSRACLDLAEDLDAMSGRAVPSGSIEELGLGSLQLQVARGLSSAPDGGASPRELTALIERNDEPNVRTALQALERRGVAERLPGIQPQRWRLSAPFRDDAPGDA